jgi:uncharacterized protein HemX
MKTKQHTPTRSNPSRRNRRLSRDTKPLFTYEAELSWTQHNRVTVKIKARSLEEAKRKANELSSEDIDDWDPCSGDMWVDSVQLAAGGGSDDE